MDINVEEINGRFARERGVLQTDHEQMFVKLARVQANVLHFLSQLPSVKQPGLTIEQEVPFGPPISYLDWAKGTLFLRIDVCANFINGWLNEADGNYYTQPFSIAISDDGQFEVPAKVTAFLETHFKA